MNRTTNILIVVAFAIGCLGLWWFISEFYAIFLWQFKGVLPAYTRLFIEWRFLLLLFPIPFLLFSGIALFKKPPTTEGNLLLLGIIAVLFLFLFFSTASVLMLPWIVSIE
jgi:hypothetical protein